MSDSNSENATPDIQIGAATPHFKAQATSGQCIVSTDLIGKNIVLYFYPRDNTPGCTTEAQDFRDMAKLFAAANCLILGVSKDSLKTHENFRKKLALEFELISDPQEELCRQFDVIKHKKLYGKEYEGIERSTFLIDASGQLAAEWRKVRVKGHAAAVLAAVEELPNQPE